MCKTKGLHFLCHDYCRVSCSIQKHGLFLTWATGLYWREQVLRVITFPDLDEMPRLSDSKFLTLFSAIWISPGQLSSYGTLVMTKDTEDEADGHAGKVFNVGSWPFTSWAVENGALQANTLSAAILCGNRWHVFKYSIKYGDMGLGRWRI